MNVYVWQDFLVRFSVHRCIHKSFDNTSNFIIGSLVCMYWHRYASAFRIVILDDNLKVGSKNPLSTILML